MATALALAACFAVSPPQAETQPAPEPEAAAASPRRWHLDISAQTSVPADVAGRLDLEMPLRLQLTTSVGAMPGPYVDVINAVVVSLDGYNEQTADLIRATLKRSLVWRTRIGWRPLKRRGLTFGAGYGLVTLGGDASASETVAALTGTAPPEQRSGEAEYDISSTLHMIDVEVGWRFLLIRDRLALRAGLGYLGTVASNTTMAPRFDPRRPQLESAFRAATTEELDDIYGTYSHTLLITLAVGVRAF